MPVYRREKSNINYYSVNAVDADKELQTKLDLLAKNVEAGLMSMSQADEMRRELESGSGDVEEVAASGSNLEAITNLYNVLAPITRDLRAAQIEMTTQLMADGNLPVDAKELKRLTGEPPKRIREWANEPALGGVGRKKSGKVRANISTTFIRELDDLVKEASDRAPGRRAKAS